MTEAARARATNPWLALGVLLAIYIFSFADRYLVTGLVGPIKHEFGLDDGFMGLLMGPAFVLLYIVAAIPIARLADRASRVRIIAIGCIVWSASTAATGLATGPWTLALARVGVGAGEAAFVAPAYSLLADFFKPERRGLAFAILGLATYFGQIAGQAGGPAIAAGHGWRMAFFAMGATGIVLALILLALVKEPGRAQERKAATPVPFGALLRQLATSRAFLFLMAAFALGTLSGVAFGYWGPELFTRAYDMNPVAAKAAFAFNFGLAGLAGMLGFGLVSDKLAKHDPVWPLRLATMALFSATACIIAVTWSDGFATARLLAIPSGLLGGGWSVGMMAMLQLILPDRYRASATAVFILMTTLAGYFVAPWLVGAISSAMGNDAHSLRQALTAVMPLGFVGALCGWLAIPHILRDRVALAAQSATRIEP